MTEQEIQKADAVLRKKTIWSAGVILVVCLLANRALSGYLGAAGDDIDLLTQRVRHAVYMLALAVLPILYFSFYFLGLARRVIAEGRFPPTGMSVIKDTAVQSGTQARRKGYFLAVFSITLGLTFIALPIIMFLLLNTIISSV